MSTAKNVQQERVRALVRTQTFRPRAGLDMLFADVDVERGAITTVWLVSSPLFISMAAGPDAAGHLRCNASMKPNAEDQWSPFRLSAAQLPLHVLARLEELEAGHVPSAQQETPTAGPQTRLMYSMGPFNRLAPIRGSRTSESGAGRGGA